MARGQQRTLIEQRVVEVVVGQLDVTCNQVAAGTRIVDDLEADSLDQVKFVVEFDKSDLDIPGNEEAIRSVGDAVE